MLTKIFLGISLIGAEWVLYLLILLSILSIAIIIERYRFYRAAHRGLPEFRQLVRQWTLDNHLPQALELSKNRFGKDPSNDLETEMVHLILTHSINNKPTPNALNEIANDAVIRARIQWENRLSVLATIGSNSPFIGLFGTVLGIMKAFHDLSQQAGAAAQTVTAGISEALVATAVGLLVAIPAVIAYNLFQKKVKTALNEAEAMKSFLIGKITQ